MLTRCYFSNVLVRVTFSNCTIFKIDRQEVCYLCVNENPIRCLFHCFQDVPASCECSLSAAQNEIFHFVILCTERKHFIVFECI